MEFYASFTPSGAGVCSQFTERLFRVAQRSGSRRQHASDFDGDVAAAKRCYRIMIRIGAIEFMRAAASQMHLHLALLGLGNYNRILRQGDARAAFSTGFREKHAVPLRAAG